MNEGDTAERRDRGPEEGESFLNRLQGGWNQLQEGWYQFQGVNREERELEKTFGPLVGLPCDDALNQVAMYLTRKGARVTDRNENRVSLAYRKQPNPAILVLLLLCLFLPGILYWMAARRDVPFTITATPVAGGCRLLYGGEHRDDYLTFRDWLKTAPGPDPTIELPDKGTMRQESNAPTNIPAQIRQLAELRDAGAITFEEFESKKKDLLDRM